MLTQAKTQSRHPAHPAAHLATKASPLSGQMLFGAVSLVGAQMSYSKGSEIHGEDEPAEYVYKIISGVARSYRIMSDGRRQIERFYFPGDIVGLEAGAAYTTSVDAVADTVVLLVRKSAVMAAASSDIQVARQLLQYTANELSHARTHATLLVRSAPERVACFLLELEQHLSASDIELPMTRQDIADYLGLTIETVSRIFTQFRDTAAIELPTSRRVVLRNRKALASLNS